MGSESNGGMKCSPDAPRVDVFALVIYIPDPLGRFLDDLRIELAPSCNPHAHVSVLPPRKLLVDWRVASAQAQGITANWRPFEVQLEQISIFPATDVVYIEVGRGAQELRRMHERMNSQSLAFDEPFAYHPHITLAQEIAPDNVSEVAELARRRWRDYGGQRSFLAEHAVFVQSTKLNCWTDLAEYSLGEPEPSVRS